MHVLTNTSSDTKVSKFVLLETFDEPSKDEYLTDIRLCTTYGIGCGVSGLPPLQIWLQV